MVQCGAVPVQCCTVDLFFLMAASYGLPGRGDTRPGSSYQQGGHHAKYTNTICTFENKIFL
jgi:hypothetical protein